MVPVLRSSDVFEPSQLLAPSTTSAFGLDGCLIIDPSTPTIAPANTATQFSHPQAGSVDMTSLTLPFAQLSTVCWQPAVTFDLLDTTAFNTISANFMLGGRMNSRINGLPQPLAMQAQTHNFIHTPEVGHLNQLPGGQSLAMFIVELDVQFVVQSLSHADAWSERLTAALLNGRPVSGGSVPQPITPRMQGLIDSIRFSPAGPLRNLAIQSQVLELIALQFEQFSAATKDTTAVSPNDADKLHRLKAYLDTHFLEDHSLAQLSRYCLLNEFKVKRGFKQLFQTTVFDYLRKLRMDYAGQLLRSGGQTIEEVADRLGYAHGHHFAAAFRNYMGVNPSQYQRGHAARR